MGRKKKTIESTNNKSSTTTNNISYAGTVKVSIAKGNKILSTKTFKNSGKPNLFKFICNCLYGEFDENSRPCAIALFNNSGQQATASDEELFIDANCITPIVINDTTPIVQEVTENGETYYTTTYHFRVPYSYINSNEIYSAALFNAKATTENIQANYYASFKFTTGEGTTLDWDTVYITKSGDIGNFSIILEWKLAIKNN